MLPTGEIIRTGGKMSKISSGYDLTQLIIGSEGTLALATEVIVKLVPRLAHGATVLAPFDDFDQVMAAVPKIISSGLAPDASSSTSTTSLMAAIVTAENLELGIPEEIRENVRGLSRRRAGEQDADRLARGRREPWRAAQRAGVRWTPTCSRVVRPAG